MLGKPLSSISCKSLFIFFNIWCVWAKCAELTLQFSCISLMNEVVHTSPTIGSNVEEIVVKNTHFLMWDIGGQESLRSSWNTYYSNTEVSSMISDFCFFTESHSRCAEVLSAGSWPVCSAHIWQQGRPRSKVIFFNRGACLKGRKTDQVQHRKAAMVAEADGKDNPGVWRPARPSCASLSGHDVGYLLQAAQKATSKHRQCLSALDSAPPSMFCLPSVSTCMGDLVLPSPQQ